MLGDGSIRFIAFEALEDAHFLQYDYDFDGEVDQCAEDAFIDAMRYGGVSDEDRDAAESVFWTEWFYVGSQ